MVDLTKYHHNRWDRVVEGLREDPRFAAVGPTDDDRREVFKAFVDEEEVRVKTLGWDSSSPSWGMKYLRGELRGEGDGEER